MSVDREALAWAAGFFDGEGTAVLANQNSTRPRDYLTPCLAVTQHYDPETIHRFHRAVNDLGSVTGPHTNKGTAYHPRWMWQCRRPHEVLAVVPMLRPWLSGPKRRQIAAVMSAYLVDAQHRRPYRVAATKGNR
jgi:hypothetical protein